MKRFCKKIDIFKDSPLIRFAEPNFVMYPASGEENEQYFDSLWGFHNWGQPILGNPGTPDVDVDLLGAWLIETGDPSCTIAVTDDGVAMDSVADTLCHPDLLDSNRIILDRAFRDGDVRDQDGHGTQVLGVAAAAKNNTGVIGACYDCKFLVTKIDRDSLSTYYWAKATAHVCSLGADVIINCSNLVAYPASAETSVAYALEKGVAIVAAAGNWDCSIWQGLSAPAGYASYGRFIQGHNCCDPETCPDYPDNCGYRNVIAVGGINRWNGHEWACSSDSFKITVTAPSNDIFVCTPSYINPDNYGYQSGTSLSAPLVGGICGLILSQKPGISPDSVRTIIERSADDIVDEWGGIGWDAYYGYGRVNALKALMAVQGYYPNVGGHLIYNDVTWKDTICMIGDVVVPDTVTLTIDSGTVVKVFPQDYKFSGADTAKCELIIEGKLKINGTQNSKVLFTSTASTPSDADWYGIRVLDTDSASAILKHADIKYAYKGIDYDNSASDTVYDCHFYNNQMYGIKTDNDLFISNNKIEKPDGADTLGYGIYISSGAAPTVDSSHIKNYAYGIYKTGSGAAVIHDNKITNGKIGAYFRNRDYVTLKRTCFCGEFSETYVKCYIGKLDIDSCYMHGDGSNSTPKGVMFVGNIKTGALGSIKRSKILNYTEDGLYASYSCPNLNSGYNSIWSQDGQGNFHTAIRSIMMLRPIPAERNWWGTSDPDILDDLFIGFVDWEPYRTTEPSMYNACTQYGGPARIASATPVAEKFSLSQNYPNPFNPSTVIQFTVNSSQSTENRPIHTTLTIYNILGQKVKTVVNEAKYPGTYHVVWDGKDEKGQSMASGIYFYRLKTDERVEVKKMLLLK